MDGQASMDPRTLAARREASRNVIAIDEDRERALVEAARSRLLASGTRSTRHAGANGGQWFLPAWVVVLGRWMTHPRFADAIAKWRHADRRREVREFEPVTTPVVSEPAPRRGASLLETNNDQHHVARSHLWRHLAGCAITSLPPSVLTSKR